MITEALLKSLSRANPGYRFERSAEGSLIAAPGGFFASGGEAELTFQIMVYAKATGLGRVFPSTGGFTLPDTSIVAPDSTFVTFERLACLSPDASSRAYIQLVPDVVFELESPSDLRSEAVRKMEQYLANGVGAGVLIGAQTVLIWRPDRVEESFDDKVAIGPEMPGFVLDVGSIRSAGAPL